MMTALVAVVSCLCFLVFVLAEKSSKAAAFTPWWKPATNTPSGVSTAASTILSSSKASLESSLQWWDDLAPPFAFPTDPNEEPSDPSEHNQDNDDDWTRPREPVHVVHFCFLVHGYRGYSRDLSYLQTVMQRVADSELKRRRSSTEGSSASFTEDETASSSSSSSFSFPPLTRRTTPGSTTSTTQTGLALPQDIVVHTPVCNERKTDDGVVSGGDRLVQEMRQVIHDEMQRRRQSRENSDSSEDDDDGNAEDEEELPRITISMLGNSLGGLYSRYAIAKLLQQCELVVEDDSNGGGTAAVNPTWILDGKYRLSLNIFCTTATPHLGVAGHTFLPIPRTAEVGVAQVMRSTGRDLFRCNDLLCRMATTAEFLRPLGHFRRRIAYANAYSTDFPVHCKTAGFLNEDSDSPHYFCEPNNQEDDEKDMDAAEADGLIIAKVYTPRRDDFPEFKVSTTDVPKDIWGEENDDDEGYMDESRAWEIEFDKEDELRIMSQTLDALGWRKIFVDARKNMPKIPLFGLSSRSNSGVAAEEDSNSNGDDRDENDMEDDRQERTESIAILREKGVVESRQLASAVTAPLFDENFHWPVGHNMIVAFSRSRLSTYLNKAGRPVVDSIAKNLVRDMLDWPIEQPVINAQEKVVA